MRLGPARLWSFEIFLDVWLGLKQNGFRLRLTQCLKMSTDAACWYECRELVGLSKIVRALFEGTWATQEEVSPLESIRM